MLLLRNSVTSCLVLLLLSCFYALAQTGTAAGPYSINGVVQDSTGTTIPGAIVFLGSTKKITTSDNSGYFHLNGIGNGTYQIGIKMIGYEPFSQNIVINNQGVTLKVLLKTGNRQMKEVVISSKTNDKQYLETFIRHFIGESENASFCTLLNPHVLRFHYDKKQYLLTASADSILIIENRSLGYRVQYMLQQFQYNYITKTTFYSGLPYFEELPATDQQKRRLAVNRLRTYTPSIMRFFRELAKNQLTQNDFSTFKYTDHTVLVDGDFPEAIDSLWSVKRLSNGLVSIKPKTAIIVEYTRGLNAVSKITPETDNALIDNNGGFTNTSFMFGGYWSTKGVADMLPLDYEPEPAYHYEISGSSPAQRLIMAIDSFNTAIPREKIFVQTDRPSYTNTDTIWLKAYVLDAALNYSRQSGLLYTELINDTGKVVLRQAMPVKLGISFGQMILDEKTIPEGSYTLRIYTNWMQNEGTQSFFTQRLYISTVSNNAWLVSEDHRLEKKDGVDNIHVSLQLAKSNKDKVRLQSLKLKVLNGEKTLQNDNITTDIEGKADVNLNLPDSKTGDLRFVMETDKKDSTHRLVIPVNISRPANIDLQFMPEGGQMVAGLPLHVGFKAVSEDGNGVKVEGNILDSKGNVAATFQSTHLGMGNFLFVPQPQEKYTAIITSPQGDGLHYPLPQVQQQGIVMHVNNPADKDSVFVSIRATDDIAKNNQGYVLICESGGKVCYAANISLADGIARGIVGKNRLQEGIARFVIFNLNHQPLAERLVFVDRHNGLRIIVAPGKDDNHPKDSVALHIKVTDAGERPVQGSFSLALTDNDLVRSGTNSTDIRTSILLTGDLKGDVEDPGYYFNPKYTDRYDALDNLLITQGWVGYSWKDVFSPGYKPAYKAESSLAVTGHISRTGGKAVGGLQVMLLSVKKPPLALDTISDAAGNFGFHSLPRIDTVNFLLQVKDKKGRMFEANIDVDKFQPADTKGLDIRSLKPWYVNSDSTLLNYMNSSRAYNKISDEIKFPGGGKLLKEVNIHAVKTVKSSHNLNGPGNADQVLDEEDMKKLDKTPLYDLLMKQVNGFGYKAVIPTLVCNCPSRGYYAIYDKQVRFVIDGVSIDFFYIPNYRGASDTLVDFDYRNFEKSIIDQFTAEDIKGIEVLYNRKYTGKYRVTQDSQLAADPIDWNSNPPTYAETMYVEITTWSGNGFFERRKSGNAIYRPLPVSWPIMFYHPKYNLKSGNKLADLRPTVLWEPNIITDASGNATVWFYAKSKAANYTGIINGSDLNGNVGATSFNIQTK